MTNPLPIELHPAANRAWLILESRYTSVSGKQDRSLADPLADSSFALHMPFLPLNSPRPHYTLLKLLLGALASPPFSNPLYNPHRKR